MKNLKDKVVVLTGASSGIGRALAGVLASKGARLVLADIREEGLSETRSMIAVHNTPVITCKTDVAQLEDIRSLKKAALDGFGTVDVVINNAGVAIANTLENVSYEDFEWLMGINFWGVVYGTKEFLSDLKKRPEASIVNISSINGMVPFPNNGPYNCSKYAVRALNETLWMELKNSSVVVTSVHPGGIRTGIARHAKVVEMPKASSGQEQLVDFFENRAMTSAEDAAKQIVRAIEGKQKRLLIGADAVLMDLMRRTMPEMSIDIINNAAKII